MIKLDSGDYINTEFVEWLGEDSDRGNQPLVRVRGYAIEITPADRDRIVEAMNAKPYKPMTRQLKRALNSAAGGEV